MGPRERAAGDRIERYTLVRPLGRGGMGEVWEAVLHGPQGFQKPVALKLLPVGPQGALERQALAHEARLGALLQHPNVVATFALGEGQGTWFVAMELVRGASASHLVRRGPLPGSAVLDIGLQACAGLQHVHGLRVDGRLVGLVHRDIKPSNLLVDRTGLVKVADLGIARVTGTGDAAGTPGYQAPEQIEGRFDLRSDVFSLGVTLVTLAIGRRPFGGGVKALVALRTVDRTTTAPEFRAALDAVVPGLGEVLGRCLRFAPEGRWPSMAELGQALLSLRRAVPAGPTPLDLLARVAPDLEIERPSTPASPSSSTATVLLSPAGNVPPARDAFHGRSGDVEVMLGLLREGRRPVTLFAFGGMGKTRLALEVARRIAGELPGGAWFVDASETRSAEELCGAVAQALGLVLERTNPIAQVGYALRGRGRTLVVLDNLEQVVEGAHGCVGRWLDLAPDVLILATSRIALQVAGEVRVPVGPLATDDAVALFLDRAPTRPGDADRPAVTAIVEALEGMPLAIELAAARSGIMRLPELRHRLTDRLRLLAGGGREHPERHRSIVASVGASWDLLPEWGRAALAQLSVFAGGFTLEAAEAVIDLSPWPEAGWAVDALQHLADASLVQLGTDRFHVLAVVQAFALGQLADAERTRAEERHGRFFAQAGSGGALQALDRLGGPERMRALATELDNLVAATLRAVSRGDAAVATATLRAAMRVYDHRGPAAAGLRLVEKVATLPLEPVDRAFAALASGRALQLAGRHAEARPRFEAALAAYGESADRPGEAATLHALANLHREQGRVDDARRALEGAVAIARAHGVSGVEAAALAELAIQEVEAGRPDAARAGFEGALALYRAEGDRHHEGVVLGNLGLLHAEHGRPAEALACYQQALAVHREVGNRRFEGVVLGNLALLFNQQGQLEDAEEGFERALAVHREVGNRRSEGIVLGNLGVLHHGRGRRDDALACHQRALAIHREIGNRRFEGHELANLARNERSRGHHREALGWLEQALAIHRAVRDRRAEGDALHATGNVLLDLGQPAEARAAFEAALAVERDAADRTGEGATLARLAWFAAQAGREAEALAGYEQALAIHREVGDRVKERHALGWLAELHRDAGRVDRAREAWEAALALATALGDEAYAASVRRALDALDR